MSKKEKPPAAPAEGEGGDEAAGGKKKLPMKMLIIAGAAAVLVLGGGGAGAFFLLGSKPAAEGEHGEDAGHGEEKAEKKGKGKGEGEAPVDPANAAVIAQGPDGVVFYTLPNIIVNMQSADGKPTFLKLKLTFELPNQRLVDTLEPNRPRLQDMFQTFLRELRPEDLSGSQGSYQLRMELQRRVNLVIAPAKINAVLIEEMLVN